MIIGLGHQAQVGKDTVGNLLVEKHGFKRISFADALRDMALDIDPVIFSVPAINVGIGRGRLKHLVVSDGWEAAKRYPEVRRFLQSLGVAVRKYDPHFWVHQAVPPLLGPSGLVYTDVRFPEEANMLKDYGATLVKIVRPGYGAINNHESEHALDDWEWDYVLNNDSYLQALDPKVDEMLEALGVKS